MAIQRGDMPTTVRAFYGLEDYDNKVPMLNTEADVIKWGDMIIKGEADRTRRGMAPVTNPTIAVVKVRFEDFKDTYNYQKTLQKNNTRTLQELARLRENADDLIQKVWDEVEETYRELPDDLRREKTKEYGVVYVFRKNELQGLSLFHNMEERVG